MIRSTFLVIRVISLAVSLPPVVCMNDELLIYFQPRKMGFFPKHFRNHKCLHVKQLFEIQGRNIEIGISLRKMLQRLLRFPVLLTEHVLLVFDILNIIKLFYMLEMFQNPNQY